MSPEFSTIDRVCHKNFEANFVADGFDSLVFRNGNLIKHVYVGAGTPEYPPPNPETLNLYFKITKRAHEIGEKDGFVFDFPYSKEKYIFRVNPFINMYKCDSCGNMEADTLYVEGDTLEIPSFRFDPKELRAVLPMANYYFEDKLGVLGINLQPRNLKSPEKGLIIVTDLCANITDLRLKLGI